MATTQASQVKGRASMAVRRLELEVPDGFLPYLEEMSEDLEAQILEDLVLGAMRSGKISVQQAASFLKCDPDDILTPTEEEELREAILDEQQGDVENWQAVRKELKL